MRVAPRESELEPGGTTTLDIEVADAAQRPVANAELAVVVVDESVLALTGYQFADPIASFYARRESGVREVHSRSLVKLAPPAAMPDRWRLVETDSAGLLARVEELAEADGELPLWDRIVIAAHLVDGLPSEGTALIGSPPGTRPDHPWSTGSAKATAAPAGSVVTKVPPATTLPARVPAPAVITSDQ